MLEEKKKIKGMREKKKRKEKKRKERKIGHQSRKRDSFITMHCSKRKLLSRQF
jgi:hypothetical protein